jgi:phage gp29-like protein
VAKKKTSRKPPADTVPQEQVTILNSRYLPEALAQGMDVGRVHSVLRAAESGDTRDLFALYRDVMLGCSHLQAEFSKRKLAVIGDPMSFLPVDKKDADDVAAADHARDQVLQCKGWRMACSHLLDSCLYPVSLLEKVYAPAGIGANVVFNLRALVPVPHHLLDFTTGVLRIWDVDPATGGPLATTHEADPVRYILHRGHILSGPDNWGGPMRSILFWWLLATMDREWWARFLDRYGSPFLLGTYPRGDADSRGTLERAFALAVKLGGLVISEDTKAELSQAAATASSGQAYADFINLCHNEISKLVLGQTLSAQPSPTGELGSGTATLQSGVREDIRLFDATLLSETLRDQLFTQFNEINGFPGQPPRIVFGSASASEMHNTIELLKAIRATDVEIADDAIATLSELTGLSLQRRQSGAAPVPFSVTPYSAAPATVRDRLAVASRSIRNAAADLVPILRQFPSAVARAIQESASAAECQERILALYSAADRRRGAEILSDAMAVHAALGASKLAVP